MLTFIAIDHGGHRIVICADSEDDAVAICRDEGYIFIGERDAR